MRQKGVTWRDFSGMSDLEKSILTLLIDIPPQEVGEIQPFPSIGSATLENSAEDKPLFI